MKNYKIAVAGTGYVGMSIATFLAQHQSESRFCYHSSSGQL